MSHEFDAALKDKFGVAYRHGKRGELYEFHNGKYMKFFQHRVSEPDPLEVKGFLDWNPHTPKES